MHLIWIFHFYLQFLLFILHVTENNLVWLQKPDEFLKHLIDPVIEGNWSKRCAIDIFHQTDILHQTEWRNFRNLLSSNMQRRIFARPTYCGVHNTSVVWCSICTSMCYTPKCAIIAMMATHKILSHLYQPEHWINCRMEQLSYEVFTVDFYLNATSSEINARYRCRFHWLDDVLIDIFFGCLLFYIYWRHIYSATQAKEWTIRWKLFKMNEDTNKKIKIEPLKCVWIVKICKNCFTLHTFCGWKAKQKHTPRSVDIILCRKFKCAIRNKIITLLVM